MAHAARILELVHGLVTTITGHTDASRSKCNQCVKRLREHNHARTNQFAVQARLDGLIEKFYVFDRDDLAEALQSRLDNLETGDKFLPDKLALFLELSDLPHRKVDLRSFELAREVAVSAPQKLTWEDIIKDDPLDEEDIWDNIERGYHSSGDEGGDLTGVAVSGRTSATDAPSVDENVEAFARAQLIQPKDDAIAITETISNAIPDSHKLAELELVRETLFMLRGLSSDLYAVDRQGAVFPCTEAGLLHVTSHTTRSIIEQAASYGSAVNFLRRWTSSAQAQAHIRSCQATVLQQLHDLDENLTTFEARMLSGAAVVSMLQLNSFAEEQTHALRRLSAIVKASISNSTRSSIVLLDNLYDAACTAYAVGDSSSLSRCCQVLFVGTETFLRPIAQWCLTGQIRESEDHPLVIDQNRDCALARVWHDRYTMRKEAFPGYLQSFAAAMFAIGKSRMLHNLLDPQTSMSVAGHAPVSLRVDTTSFVPVSQQIHQHVSVWLNKLSVNERQSLSQTLNERFQICEHFYAINRIFFHDDGTFCANLAEVLPRQNSMTDFMLTQMARESCAQIPGISTDDISISVKQADQHDKSSVAMLGSLHMKYMTPWYVASIMNEESPSTHSQVFTLLLQLYLAKDYLKHSYAGFRGCPTGRATKASTQLGCLSHCLNTFIDTLSGHITTTAQALSSAFTHDLRRASSIDTMIEAYVSFKSTLAVTTLVAPQLSSVRKAVVDILSLAESLDRVTRRGGEQASAKPSLIDKHLQHYMVILQKIIANLQDLASEQNNENLELLAEMLKNSLPASLQQPGRKTVIDRGFP